MSGIGHWPIKIKNMDGEEFLVCSRECSWQPKGRFPLFDPRTLSTFLYTLPPWEFDKVQDLVLGLDQAKVSVEGNRKLVKRADAFRMKDALGAGEILVYTTADPDEAALKALREKIQLVLTEILTQERAEAARLEAEHSNRNLLEKAGAHAVAGAKGLGQAGLSFLTWAKDVYEVVSIHERQRRMMQAAWETYNSDSDDWVGTFKNRMIAAEHKEVVEALGFDPLKVDREMLAEAYEVANLVWEDEKTQQMLVAFAEDYARAQHSLEWTNIAGGAAFEIILTVVLTVFTGGAGTAAMFGGKVRLLTPMKKLGGLFEELAKLRRRFKLRKTKGKGSAGGKPSSLDDYVTDEPVPKPSPPPKGKPRQEGDLKKADSDKYSSSPAIELDEKGKFLGEKNAGPHTPKFKSWLDKGGTVKYDKNTDTFFYGMDIKKTNGSSEFVEIPYKPGPPDGDRYPDFSDYSDEQVKIENMTGLQEVDIDPPEVGDFSKAWDALEKQKGAEAVEKYGIEKRKYGDREGLYPDKSPQGSTWHHVQDGETMQLIDKNIHGTFKHKGGASYSRSQ